MNNSIHFVLSPKGGVGKSYVSALLSEYLILNMGNVLCVDADPISKTLSKYKHLRAVVLENMYDEFSQFNAASFDYVFNDLLIGITLPCVLDIGCASFPPFLHYINDCNVMHELLKKGKSFYFHIPIALFQDCEEALKYIQLNTPDGGSYVLWENYYLGSFSNTIRDVPKIKLKKLSTESFYVHLHGMYYKLKELTDEELRIFIDAQSEHKKVFSQLEKLFKV